MTGDGRTNEDGVSYGQEVESGGVGMLVLSLAVGVAGWPRNAAVFGGGQSGEHALPAVRAQAQRVDVGGLQVKWQVTTAGDVSATPAVDGDTVYAPDWAGNLYAVDRKTGAVKWTASIPGRDRRSSSTKPASRRR